MEIDKALEAVDHAVHQDDRWMVVALPVIGMITICFLARCFIREGADLQREIVPARTEFEQHLKTANAEMVAALTRSTEVIAHNSMILEQLQRRLTG